MSIIRFIPVDSFIMDFRGNISELDYLGLLSAGTCDHNRPIARGNKYIHKE